ncbi:MAG: hypothetical protein ACJ8M4_02270 [Chthoniobacterales bacterium]
MKRLNSAVVGFMLAACGLFLASADQSIAGQSDYSRGGDGILRMKHSPVLGINIPIAVWIDGHEAGAFAKGHVYERALSPGLHTLYASRPSQKSDSWYGTIDVQPGQTLSFVVSCNVDHIFLTPVSRVD